MNTSFNIQFMDEDTDHHVSLETFMKFCRENEMEPQDAIHKVLREAIPHYGELSEQQFNAIKNETEKRFQSKCGKIVARTNLEDILKE